MVLKPKFSIKTHGIYLIFISLAVGYGVGIFAIMLPLNVLFSVEWFPLSFYVWFGITFISYIIGIFVWKKIYTQTEYRVFQNTIEYSSGFMEITQKSVQFKDIKEVNFSMNVVQRFSGLGTIILATPAAGLSTGVKIRDIETSRDVYQKLKNLVESSSL